MSITARGGNARLAACFETTYGTLPSSPAGILLPINSSKIAVKQNLIESVTITGRRDPVQAGRGNIDVSGNVVIPIDQIAIGHWLRGMFGDPATMGAGPYTHKFTLGNTQKSLAFEQQFPDINTYELFNGCKISKFSLALALNNSELTGSIDIMGAKRTLGNSPFSSTLTDSVLNRFSAFQGSVEEGGAAIATVVSADMNIEFGLDGDTFALGSNGVRADLVEGIVKVTGTIKALFQNTTLLNKAINNTESSLKLKLNSGTSSLEFFMEEVMYEQTSPGIEGSKGIFIELPYRAYYQNGTGNSVIVATLTNSQAAYV